MSQNNSTPSNPNSSANSTPNNPPKRRKRETHQPGYIGHARHCLDSNLDLLKDRLQQALAFGASEITLTLRVPHNARNRKHVSLHVLADLPVLQGFRVVQVNDCSGDYYIAYRSASWADALAWLNENRRNLPRHLTWAIYGVYEAGLTDGVNLLDFYPVEGGRVTRETPPVEPPTHNMPQGGQEGGRE